MNKMKFDQTTTRRQLLSVLLGVLAALTLVIAFNSHAQSEMADGEIRRLDMETGKVTIRHGEIKSLDMPPMTMVFVARPKSILDGLEVGDKIQFVAIEENKQYIMTKVVKQGN